MKLQPEPFAQISSGTKQIEIRLFDEKRQQISVGDIIIFSRIDDESDTIQVQVINLVRFGTFKELFNCYDPALYGSDSAEDHESMYQYYSREEEHKCGVLAIHFKLFDSFSEDLPRQSE